MAFAETTKVPFDRTVSEILTLIRKNGADRIAQAEEPGKFVVQCFINDRLLRFSIEVPESPQARRQRGRALLLVIKAKFESVVSGVETFEQAFLANVVMPGGQTVYDQTKPQIEDAYTTGKTPQLMLSAN